MENEIPPHHVWKEKVSGDSLLTGMYALNKQHDAPPAKKQRKDQHTWHGPQTIIRRHIGLPRVYSTGL